MRYGEVAYPSPGKTSENEVALQRAEMRMVRWMCGLKLQDRNLSKGLREKLGLDDIISVLQQNSLRWYGHVLRKEDNNWVKKCVEYEVEGAVPRGRPVLYIGKVHCTILIFFVWVYCYGKISYYGTVLISSIKQLTDGIGYKCLFDTS